MVGQVVKAIKQEHCCIGASTPRAVHSTKVVGEYMVEMTIWMAMNDN